MFLQSSALDGCLHICCWKCTWFYKRWLSVYATIHTWRGTQMRCNEAQRTSAYLYLTIIADGFNGDGGSQRAVGVPGLELHNILGPAH